MLIKDAWAYYADATKQASAIVRQLALAGIAIAWIFKNDALPDHSKVSVPQDFYAPTILMVATLGFDLFQYLFAGVLWWGHARCNEQAAKDVTPGVSVTEIPDAPRWVNWAPLVFFGLKLAALVWGFILLFGRLWPHVSLKP
jgi:hypothetical protein